MRPLPALLLTALLAACAGQPTEIEHAGWDETRAELEQLKYWRTRGKAGLRSPERSESANLIWSQQDENSTVYLSGPLGMQNVTVRSDGRNIEVRNGDDTQRWDLSDPQVMLEPTTWGLPIDALRFWIKGIPAPGEVDSLQVEGGVLASLQQLGWQVDYSEHRYFGPYRLPTRMEIRRGDNSVRLILREWTPLIQ